MFTVTTETAFRENLWKIEDFVLLCDGVRVEKITWMFQSSEYYRIETAKGRLINVHKTYSLEFVGGFTPEQLKQFLEEKLDILTVPMMTESQFTAGIVFQTPTPSLVLIEWQLRHIRADKPFSNTFTYGLAHKIVSDELKYRQEKPKLLNQRIFEYFNERRINGYIYIDGTNDFKVVATSSEIIVYAKTDDADVSHEILNLVTDSQGRVHCLYADICGIDKEYSYLALVKEICKQEKALQATATKV